MLPSFTTAFRCSRLLPALLTLLVLAGASASAEPLVLRAQRTSPFDLALRGHLATLAQGQEKYVSWADLHALPLHSLKLPSEFFAGEQEVTVVYLSDLWEALPRDKEADVVLAVCADGYASVYRHDFIKQFRPFLILEINGIGPEKWPPPGLAFNPAPYVISVSALVAPATAGLLDANHKKPWGVTTLEFASYREAFHDAETGPWARLSDRAVQGREIWVNSCASCHAGPGAIFGGSKSRQPFAVLRALAAYDPKFFRLYVRDPKAANPSAAMEAHPHYSDGNLDSLLAFILAEPAK